MSRDIIWTDKHFWNIQWKFSKIVEVYSTSPHSLEKKCHEQHYLFAFQLVSLKSVSGSRSASITVFVHTGLHLISRGSVQGCDINGWGQYLYSWHEPQERPCHPTGRWGGWNIRSSLCQWCQQQSNHISLPMSERLFALRLSLSCQSSKSMTWWLYPRNTPPEYIGFRISDCILFYN
jgi:hypothetical protein